MNTSVLHTGRAVPQARLTLLKDTQGYRYESPEPVGLSLQQMIWQRLRRWNVVCRSSSRTRPRPDASR